MKIALFVVLFVMIACAEGSSQKRPCSTNEAVEAERTVQELNTWDDVYRSFKRFGHCDDGAIAEGYSHSIVHLLSSHWGQLGDLNELSSSDAEFLPFVIRHIDATVDEGELKEVIINSSKHCPKSAKELCLAIEKVSKNALLEMQKGRR